MNWIKKVLHFSEKIKKVIKKRATKEEIASSDDCYKMHSCTEQKEDDMLELYKFPQSTCSLKVRICLAEKNLD